MVRVPFPAKLRSWSELTAQMVMGVVPGLLKKDIDAKLCSFGVSREYRSQATANQGSTISGMANACPLPYSNPHRNPALSTGRSLKRRCNMCARTRGCVCVCVCVHVHVHVCFCAFVVLCLCACVLVWLCACVLVLVCCVRPGVCVSYVFSPAV